MLAKERQRAIVERVNRQGSVLVKELAQDYKMTEDSIRKDLTLLERQGLLKKTYGGAIKVREKMHDLLVSQRLSQNTTEKKKIAKQALSLIEEGDMVYLDTSTTNLELARLIVEANRKVTIVSNMVEILLLMARLGYDDFICVGGQLSPEHDGFDGNIAHDFISHYRFDKAFLGCVGVNQDKELVYNHSVAGGLTKQLVMSLSSRSYVLVEERKLAMEGNFAYASLSELSGLIFAKGGCVC